jgi:hypothetical protein
MPNIIGLNNTQARTELSLCLQDLIWKTLRGNTVELNSGPDDGTLLWAVFRISFDHMKLFVLLVIVQGRICNKNLKRTCKIFKQCLCTIVLFSKYN